MRPPSGFPVLLILLAAAGCRSAPPLPPYDSKQAEETLVLALEAWKQGRVGDLARRKPPVRFVDEDYRNGMKLTDYRLVARESHLRAFEDAEVVLVLRNRQGKTVEETVTYQVTLTPRLAVIRSD